MKSDNKEQLSYCMSVSSDRSSVGRSFLSWDVNRDLCTGPAPCNPLAPLTLDSGLPLPRPEDWKLLLQAPLDPAEPPRPSPPWSLTRAGPGAGFLMACAGRRLGDGGASERVP